MIIELEFSKESFMNLQQKIKAYIKNLEKSELEITKELLEQGEILARNNASSIVYGEGKQASMSDNKIEVIGNSGRLYNDNDKAVYAEFGTGIVGSRSPHPNREGWIYDVNNHGELGWWFPTNDPSLIKRTSEEGQGYGWTKGESSQPYMYETAKQLRLLIPTIAKKYIQKEE